MISYRRLFEKLKKNPIICPKQDAAEAPTKVEIYAMPVISCETLDRMIEQMEDIMYSLDGDKLLELITELEKYQYKGEALKEVLVPIRRKVESYDYVSAVESMIRWKNGLPK